MKRAAVLIVSVALGLALPRAAGAAEREHGDDVAAASGAEYAAHGGPLRDAPAARLAATAQAAALPVSTVGGTWRDVGPSPMNNDDPKYPSSLGPFGLVAGQVTALAADPTNPNVVYAGARAGGVWKSTDGGDHWTPVSDQLPSLIIGALAIDPDHPQTIFAGTGDANVAGDAYGGSGVFRSRDGGATWDHVSANVVAAGIGRIEVAGGRVFVASTNGLYRSTNGGDSYEAVPLPTNTAGTAPATGDYANFVTDVKVKPGALDEVTVAVGWHRGVQGSQGNGLYRSTTGGAPGSFQRLATSGLGLPLPSGDPLGRISLAYASGPNQDHNVLWAVVQDAGLDRDVLVGDIPLPAKNSILNGVFRSGNDGATWDLKAAPQQLIAAPGTAMVLRGILLYAPGVQAWYNQWIAVDPSNAETVLLGLEEIYKTTANANGPGPAVWQTIGRYSDPCPELPSPQLPPCPPLVTAADLPSSITTHPDQHAASLVRTAAGTRAYVGNDGGVWRQDATSGAFDNDHWSNLNATLRALQPYRAVMSGDGTIYFGLQDNGTGKTTGPTTGSAVLGGDGTLVAVHPKDSKIAYAMQPQDSLNRTTDGGVNWTDISPTLSSPIFDTPMQLDPLNPAHMLVAGRQIMASSNVQQSNNGAWTQVLDLGVTSDGKDNSSTTLDVRGNNAYVGWCGHCNLFHDGGGDPTLFANGIATNVGANCQATADTSACWHKADAHGLPNRYITSVAIDPNDPRTVYVALGNYSAIWYRPQQLPPRFGAGHLFVSHDAGGTFTDASSNLPDSPVTSVQRRGGDVLVGTEDGVYVASVTATGVGPFARLGSGLPHVPVWDIQLDPSGAHLVTATHGRGVWVFDFAATTPAAAPIPRGVIAVTGRSGDQAIVAMLVALALLLRVVSRERRGSRRRRALSAR